MNERPRWVVVLIVALIVGALVTAARGRAHHRGDEVGEGASVAVTSPGG
jgi:hypothetical protein